MTVRDEFSEFIWSYVVTILGVADIIVLAVDTVEGAA
jgi:hypothetical protein